MKKNLPISYIEISKDNLIYNILQFKKLAKEGTEIGLAIKGNAYGHGQNVVAKILEKYVDYFLVNSFDELKELRKVTKKKTFILGYVEKKDLAKTLKLNSVISIFSKEQLEELDRITTKFKTKAYIHILIDAYLGREGFLFEELDEVFNKLKNYKYIEVFGMYAHFANIEDTNNFTHAKKQINEYKKGLKLAEKFGYKNLYKHISATSGLLVYEKNKGINSIVRIGIGAYGLWPSLHIEFLYKRKMQLKPVLSWKTKVAQIKNLKAGRTIGYGLTYMTYKDIKIAILPIGYADGLDRKLSNKGKVLINGEKCKILGRISMNMTVVDVSHLENIKIEDEVVIIGKQEGEIIKTEDLAQIIDTINYEITTRISPLIPRVVV